MRFHYLKSSLKALTLGMVTLLLGVLPTSAQVTVTLTASQQSTTLPDGTVVPMWGLSCVNPSALSTSVGNGGTCGTLAGKTQTGGSVWQPPLITVPYIGSSTSLTIKLTNNLPSPVPTSLVIVGQLGGGLGDTTQRTTSPSPSHENMGTTWPIANTGPVFVPPSQGARVQSFSSEVTTGATLTLPAWASLRPGTYLIESGTHPSIQGPMGLYGVLVVTTAPSGGTAGTAYTGVSYNAEVPLLLSEIDPNQNKAVAAAVNTPGFVESAVHGPYSAQPVASINLINGGTGYTSAPTVSFSPSGASATAVVDSDPTSSTYQQVTAINITNGGSYTSAPSVSFTGGGGTGAVANSALQLANNTAAICSGGAAACYPSVVNYTPLYYLINGVAFDKTNAQTSLFAASPASGVTGSVLVRMVNAGLRMHVPSIVGAQTGSASPAASGFSLIAEDGNVLPGIPRVQSEVFMAAGKTYDVMINVPTSAIALPIFDRELSLSGNAIARDAGMLAYIGVNGATVPTAAGFGAAVAKPDTYNSLVCLPSAATCNTLSISDPFKGVIANDTNVYGVQLLTQAGNGTVTLSSNGTFTYIPKGANPSDSFTYCANGTVTGTTCSSGVTAKVTIGAAPVEAGSGIVCTNPSFTSAMATYINIPAPGVLAYCKDTAGYPLKVDVSSVTAAGVTMEPNGGFVATGATGSLTFTFKAKNSQGTLSASAYTVTVTFPKAANLAVSVVDGMTKTPITDYRWIIEEDRTFYVDPKCTTNPPGAGCPAQVLTFGTNFHTSYMPLVATGCTGPLSCESGQSVLGTQAVCDAGNGICRTTDVQQTAVDPKQVAVCPNPQTNPATLNCLDPSKRYYISVLPGDAANPFNAGNASACLATTDPNYDPTQCGHGMGGAPIAAGQTSVTVLSEPTPLQPAKLSVFVFEDDLPLNGEHDAGGGIDVLSPNEPGLGGFQITLFDDAGGTGDATGQPTYDMFNMPLSNSLAGTIDPATGKDACPITPNATTGFDGTQGTQGITGMIVTCPKYESDGTTLSPLAGQAVVANLYPGRYGVVATPNADRIAKGEEWLQTNTLDGQHAHDSFLRVGEPGYFQEFGPAGYHVTIGFANPQIINQRGKVLCSGRKDCTNTVTGQVTSVHMSRTPDERLYSSGSRDAFSFTQCYVSLGDPDDEDFAFAKCDQDGNFTLNNIPPGDWKLAIFDQWNDQIVDGIATPVSTKSGSVDMGPIAVNQWQANIYTSTFFDLDGNGVRGATEPGLALVATNIRFRDGSYSNFNNTDLNGNAGFNEVFPLFSWYVIETDSTRYKNTGTHVVYDAGGPSDGSPDCGKPGTPPCGGSTIGQFYANTAEQVPLPTTPSNLRVPGSVYCDNADCNGFSIASGPITGGSSGPGGSTGRIDAPWANSYGWQGFAGQNSFLEFGKKPFAAGENGGIHGHVIYASTRPFDDPQLLLQLSWEPMIPHVTINLYREGTAPDGTPSLKLVDTTQTSSFDDWAQGFRSDGVPNMNCPGQTTADPFFSSLQNQPSYLDWYNSQHGGPAAKTLPKSSQFKCYDGMHNWNQLQPAPYDGMYSFPSVTGINPTTGLPTGTNCDPSVCVKNPDKSDPYRYNQPMLPAGKYVVEVVVPPGYELVKEEDKNILIGDNYIAPVTQQFAGLGNVFIMPDQAEVAASYNSYNSQNATQGLGRIPTLVSHEGDTGSDESFWPCVGQARVVPDYISLFPGSAEVAPFAGATRNLCDRKEVTLTDQTAALAKFYLYTSTHVASHFTGVITDDLTSEFDPFSPQFGEKFAPAYLPVSIKDFNGNEVNRVYADQWGAYNGLNYSTWEVNPPNPTGYAPTMMVTCMNDAGSGLTPDALFQPGYSQFCYELPFMPGQTGYFDTPVVSVSAFSEGYNHPDCEYPDATPAISSVTSQDIAGPWVQSAGHSLTINALGLQQVENYAYSGPSQTAAPYNQQKVTRNYVFGSCTISNGACTNGASVTIGGVPATITAWSPTQITVNVNLAGVVNGQPVSVPSCAVTQQTQYSGLPAQCGELVITASNGRQSVDAVTVTIGGKKPSVLAAGKTIQSAIDAAAPGDMIIIPPGKYSELLLMWKPVRLQGVGAASSIIDANPHPAGKLNPWRREVGCLFGLAMNGQPSTGNVTVSNGQVVPGSGGSNPYDGTGTYGCPWAGVDPTYFSGGPNYPTMIVDRLPMEGILGWDTTVNGNLAEQLIEPGLMGAYEGAAITVLAKGVNIPSGATDVFGSGAEAAFPAGSLPLATSDCTSGPNGKNLYPTNFWCNPSSVDGLGVINSSQGGGGIFVHGWAHNVQIANNRVRNNTGTLAGGITIGQGEHVDVPLQGDPNVIPPGSCQSSNTANQALPYCYDMNVNVHHNQVMLNSSIGDELFSSTPAGAGGVAICNGSDYYKFNYNWVCGNLSSGDGAGYSHIGFSYNGDIEHNSILFNQSTNPTVPTNGGGILVMGAPDPDPACGATTDKDCVPAVGEVPPSDGTGPNLLINANLIMGNAAEAGSGGGIRLQHVNGTDVINLPTASTLWNKVTLQNNIIANNVAGWDGAGVSLQDAMNVDVINNTIISNDTTASSGVLFNTLFAPLSSSPYSPGGTNCQYQGISNSQSCPQIAGVASNLNSPNLVANLATVNVNCPTGHPNCKSVSFPRLFNNVIWENRSFFIGVDPLVPGDQQSVVKLYNAFTTNLAPSQPQTDVTTPNGAGFIITGGTGACTTASYWDIGVRGDNGPTNHGSGFTLAPTYSVLTSLGSNTDYAAAALHNTAADPTVASQYCNGSRVPPELGAMGYLVPPGTNESNVPTAIFNLTPNATVDEGNNWINMRWGPLSLSNAVSGATLGKYVPTSSSSTLNYVPSSAGGANGAYTLAPSLDFFGTSRKTNSAVDAGAVEFIAAPISGASLSPSSLAFGTWAVGTTSPTQNVTVTNTGNQALTGGTFTLGAPFVRVTTGTFPNNAPNCTANLAVGAACTIKVQFAPTTTGNFTNGSLAVTYTGATVTPASVTLTGTAVANRATVSIAPNPLTITFPTPVANLGSGTGTVTLTNTAPAGGAQMTVTNVVIASGSGSGLGTWFFNGVAGQDNCTGTTLAPGANCTVGVRFTNVTSPVNVNRPGTITFTDNAAASPQVGNLVGRATP